MDLDAKIDYSIQLSGKSNITLVGEFGDAYTEATTLKDYLDNDLKTYDEKILINGEA
jgi:hypothetical protein